MPQEETENTRKEMPPWTVTYALFQPTEATTRWVSRRRHACQRYYRFSFSFSICTNNANYIPQVISIPMPTISTFWRFSKYWGECSQVFPSCIHHMFPFISFTSHCFAAGSPHGVCAGSMIFSEHERMQYWKQIKEEEEGHAGPYFSTYMPVPL